VLAHTTLTASVRVGSHVAIMPHVTLTHDDQIEDFVTIASGVRLGGGVRVGFGAYLGAGALVREGVSIGAGALVGMGAVVLRDVPPGEVWAGSPARRLRPGPASSQEGSS
jgi:acetyltransferase-like isoleucine patch superfamily enzyme